MGKKAEQLQKRIDEAAKVAYESGGYDGSHHKMWVIDQMLRKLLGEEGYAEWVAAYQSGSEGPLTYEWDEGCPP